MCIFLEMCVCQLQLYISVSACLTQACTYSCDLSAYLLFSFASVSTYSSEAMEEFRDMDLGDRS